MTSKRKSKSPKLDLETIKASVATIKKNKGSERMCPYKTGSPESDAWLKIFRNESVETGTEIAEDTTTD